MKKFLDICRVLVGLTFVFSGAMKLIDPWGTALKLGEYQAVWGIGGLEWARIPAAIIFCAAELTLGLMLVFGICKRLAAWGAAGLMVFFTLLTFLSATLMPVGDCGCFGEAVKLGPWLSFGKNLVLLTMILAVAWGTRGTKNLGGWLWIGLFAAAGVAFGTYNYRHLPLVDFLPFKLGLNLRQELEREDGDIALRQFVVFGADGDVTAELLAASRTYLLVAARMDEISERDGARFEKIVRRADEQGAKVVLLTSSAIDEGQTWGTRRVPVYNADPSMLISLLRARVGVVAMENGVIIDKKNVRDI